MPPLPEHLNQAQVTGLIGLGALFWATGAAMVRYGSKILLANNLRRIGTYIGLIPMSYAMIRISEEVLSTTPKQRLTTTVILICSASLLDGVALMWLPNLYENQSLKKKNSFTSIYFSRMGAAAILWGGGICLLIALLTQP